MTEKELTEMVFKFDYGETKDLLKTFMTLISGTLVVSVAFAEKIIGVKNSDRAARNLLITCWAGLVAALVLCGIATCLVAMYMAKVVYGEGFLPGWHGPDFAVPGLILLVLAGGTYVAALICMILASIRSMNQNIASATEKT